MKNKIPIPNRRINNFNPHHIKYPSSIHPYHDQIIIPSLNQSNYFNIPNYNNFQINNNNFINTNANIVSYNQNQINFNYNNNYVNNNNFLINNNNYNSSRNHDNVKNIVSSPVNFSPNVNKYAVNNDFNSIIFQNNKIKENINFNYNNNNFVNPKNQKINFLKNWIERNGKKITNIDINSEFQDTDLNSDIQTTFSNQKINEDVLVVPFNNNILNKNIKNENPILNNNNSIINFQINDKKRNSKKNVKDRTLSNLKYSNSVKNIISSKGKIENFNSNGMIEDNQLNNTNYKNNLNKFEQRINFNPKKKISCKIPVIKNMGDNIYNENADNNQIDEKLENELYNLKNYQLPSHINTLENSLGNKTPKGNSGNKMKFNPNKILMENSKFKIYSENNEKKKCLEKIKEKSPKDRKSKNNIKRIKAKSNNINFNLNEIEKNGGVEKKYNNIANNLLINFERNKNFNKKTSDNNNPIIINDRKSINNKSPSKLNINNTKKINEKSRIIPIKESLNRSENISPSDIENDEDNNLKINNFNDILRNKNRTLNTLENINNQKINNIFEKPIQNYNQEKLITETNFMKNSTDRDKTIDLIEKKKIIEYKSNYYKKYSADSLAGKDCFGKRKINQDLYLVKTKMNNIEGFNAFGVLDGHGEYGHKVSSFTRNEIINEINDNLEKIGVNSLSEIYSELKKNDYMIIKKAYKNIDKKLQYQKFNSYFSGTTCVIVFQIGNNLITANVGDSRAILIYSDDPKDENLENSKVFKLSKDQKPELPEEKKRIIKNGGIVDQMLDKNKKRSGPFRVWAGKENFPGLAMSRSIGDLKGKKFGLISEPEIIEYKLNEKSKFMVICSDGVWEFLKNEDVMNMGKGYYKNNNIDGFLKEIIRLSEYWWEKEDIIRDDITAVIVFF